MITTRQTLNHGSFMVNLAHLNIFLRHSLLVLVLFLVSNLSFAQQSNSALLPQNQDFSLIAKDASRSVVNVINISQRTNKLVPDELRSQLESTPLMEVLKQLYGSSLEEKLSGKTPVIGSGCIISEDGYIVTNSHVIEGGNKILVRLSDRREFDADVIGYDPGTDLALLKINSSSLPALKFANSDQVKVGQWVLAIGSPFGFDNTLTAGIVSAIGRSLNTERYVPYIQTDAAVNPGNSGGPLLNTQGEIIGINSQIVSESGAYAGLSFAVPSNVVKRVVLELKEHGKVVRGWLGLAFQDLDYGLAESFGLKSLKGALIAKVLPNSPAHEAGLQAGDIILSMNEHEILRASDLPPIIGMMPIDSQIDMKIIRQKQIITSTVTLKKYQENQTQQVLGDAPLVAVSTQENEKGITVRNMEKFDRSKFSEVSQGVMVMNVTKQPWLVAGIRSGDVIISLNNQMTPDEKSFYATLNSLNNLGTIPVLVARPGQVQRYIAVNLGK